MGAPLGRLGHRAVRLGPIIVKSLSRCTRIWGLVNVHPDGGHLSFDAQRDGDGEKLGAAKAQRPMRRIRSSCLF